MKNNNHNLNSHNNHFNSDKTNDKHQPNIHLLTGEGAGKTTSALGVALRAVGHNQKVVIVQFMKGRKEIGEYKIRKKLAPYYEIYQFGRKEFIDLKNPSEKDKELAKKGLEFAKKIIKTKPTPKLLILDEINLACAIGLLDINEVLKFLEDAKKKSITVYLTGRYAHEKLKKVADFVNEIKLVKAPEKYPNIKGITY